MAGIKVEVKRGKRWWYVVADFGDGSIPVTKGPMAEADAIAMADELRNQEGAIVRDQSPDEEKENRRVAFAFFATVGAAILFVILLVVVTVVQ